MVFEAIVVDILNRVLGEYVENLDTSQLKIGIWGGDVVLKNLALKATALSELDLPVKVTWGQLGRLVLKIPWKNIYKEPVIVNIDDLLLLVSPESDIVYIPEREEKWAQDAKQAELARVEEAKKRAAEKDDAKADDSFVEKLTTQIIKNVQVSVQRIHIRYEDKTTRGGQGAFSVGATMNNLSMHTTDENGTPCLSSTAKFIYKSLTLDGLAVYWNPSGELLSDLPLAERIKRFQDDIPAANVVTPGYSYMFGPLSSSAALVMNPKPEVDGTNFTTPKLQLNINMSEFNVALTRRQFQDMMLLVENMDRLSKGRRFRMYRPGVGTVLGHARTWWHFAYKCVMVDIQRRRNEWTWAYILLHRQRCKEYLECYTRVLTPKPSADDVQRARQLESQLDVLNLVMLRQRAAVEAHRLAVAEEKARASRGWFSGWFSSQPTAEEQFTDAIAKKIENVMTPEEKLKLYDAIGYQENVVATQYPVTFVATQMKFMLSLVRVTVFDDEVVVLNAELRDLGAQLDQRPSANALKVSTSFGRFSVDGMKQRNGENSHLVISNCDSKEHLVDACYETSPLDDLCDQRVVVKALPLLLVYHHETVSCLQDIFSSADPSGINQMKARTAASLPTFKQVSAMGLQFAVERRSRIDVQVDVSASTILVPYGGVFVRGCNMLVVRLGQLSVNTDEQKNVSDVSVRKLFLQGSTEEEIFTSILSESYTKFNCRLSGVQILMRVDKEDWEAALQEKSATPLHILQRTDLEVVIKKSLVTEDARIPKMIIEGVLPSVCVQISDERVLALATLAFSMQSAPTPVKESHSRSSSTWSLASISSHLEQRRKESAASQSATRKSDDAPIVQGTDLICTFRMNEFAVNVLNKNGRFLRLAVLHLNVELVQRTLDMVLDVKLSAVEMLQRFKHTDIAVLGSASSNSDACLVSLHVVMCERNSPELFTTKGGVLTSVLLSLTQMNIVLHQAALRSLIDFANNLSAQIDAVKRAEVGREADSGPALHPKKALARKLSLILEEDGQRQKSATKVRRKGRKPRVEVIDLKADVVIERVGIDVVSETPIGKLAVEGISLSAVNRRTSATYGVVLQGLMVQDLDPLTTYSLVVWSADREAIRANVTMYNKDQLGDLENDKLDMRVDAAFGQLRLVFLQRFIVRLLSFMDAFQTAKEAVIEASAAAAERAKQNVMKAYDDATRIALNVNMKAPFIVVPRNSKSTDALVIDLGTVSIKNTIKDLERSNEGTPVLDIMRLDLHELKLMRVAVKPSDLTVLVEYPLLDPVTFELVVNRNLSAAWYHAVPDLELSSRLGSIRIDLDQMDYAFMMAVLQENLGEGGDGEAIPEGRQSVAINAADREGSASAPAVHTAIMFTFAMDSFTISLHNGGCAILTEDVRPVSKRRGLAQFVIQTLALKGKMFSDGAIYTSIRLLDCVLIDNRVGLEGRLTTLMERKRDEDNLTSMIDITYQQKLNNKFVDVRVSSFVLVLSMEFLLQLGGFFTIEDNKDTDISSDAAVRLRHGKARPVAAPPIDPKPPSVHPDDTMTIDLCIERPDIILVENMDNIETDAIIFHTEIVLKYRTVGIKQVINATVNNLQLYSCCFNPAKRNKTMKEVVKPMTVSLAGSTPEGKGLHLDLHCTPVVIAVSPSTIHLLSKCYAAFNGSSSTSQLREEPDWSNVWTPNKFEEHDYWFLQTDEALEALDTLTTEVVEIDHDLQELCMIDMPLMLITVEAGVGNRTVPMVLLEIGFTGQARNWTNGLQLESTLSFGMQYYNASLSLWEPLVEPVPEKRRRQVEFKPWQLNCVVSMNKTEEEDVSPGNMTPGMSVALSARDTLEVTVTRSCLDVLSQLGEAFSNAVAVDSATANIAPAPGTGYIFCNDSGMQVVLLLRESRLKIGSNEINDDVTLQNHEQVDVRVPDDAITASPDRITYSPTSPSHRNPGHFLSLKIEQLDGLVLQVPLDRACKRLYPIRQNNIAIVCEIACGTSSTVVTLRSIVQIHNHFSVTLECFYMTNAGNMVEKVGQVEPHGTLNLPLYSVYTKTSELFFSVYGYSVSIIPFVWKDLQGEMTKELLMQCEYKNKEDVDPFFIIATGEVEQVYLENSSRHTLASMCYNIHLQPTVELVNSLPTTLTLAAQGGLTDVQIPPGTRAQVPHANPGKSIITLRISDYLDKEWSCRVFVPKEPTEFTVWMFESFDSATPVSINLGAHCSFNRGTLSFSVYCPFWMINKTGLMLSYKLDDSTQVMYHPDNYADPIMLSPNSKKFLGKKKGQVKVGQGFWSDKFSLDVAGSSGLIECRSNENKLLLLSVNIKLTDSSLTKMIILTPAYVVVNETNLFLELQEVGTANWLIVEPKYCAPFWPSKDRNSRLVIRVKETSEISPPFDFHSTHTCLLQLHNMYGGILADVQSTAGGIYINLFTYEPGLAPALIINHTDQPLTLKEKDVEGKFILKPRHRVMCAWQQPAGSRSLIWSTGNKDIVISLNEDAAGEVNKEIWYVSFLDGLQRILLVTRDTSVALAVQAAGTLERPLSKISLSLSGMGLSIVNNRPPKSVELLYMGFASSGIQWETRKINQNRFKQLPLRESNLIEEAYNKYNDDLASGRLVDHIVVIDNKLQVNLETLQLLAPNKRELRRSFQPAVWAEMTQTEHTSLMHGKINRLQLDNQTASAIFPVILAPVPPPKTVAAGRGPKPFVELSILKRVTPHSAVQQYKYFQVLVQEFHIKLDVGFVHALLEFLEADEISESVAKQRFLLDVELSKKPLLDHIAVVSSQEHKDFYDLLHFSPLKIHLSFSMSGNMESKSLPAAFNLLLQSLGVTLTDIQDAVFKLACLERKNIFLTQSQLIGEATTHYTGQALRQVYVLLLGLDVIGNPYGLVTGIGEGVEALFYEPFQGMIQGPAEFAEGLGLGVKSLFGHTVGGAAGAFGRITGTLGKGLAALSMDKDYQQERLQQQHRRPDNLHTSMAQGGRGLVMGVVHGVTGVVTKPIAGAKEEGVGGFFKGFGKGMVGLVTRPVSGVVDFASTSLNAVKRATEQGSEAVRLRPPRLLRGAALEPFETDAAEGSALLAQIDNRKFAATDEYEYHVHLQNGDVLILTDKRFIIATISDVFGTWQVILSLRWAELHCAPTLNPKGVSITLEKKKQSAFSSFSQGRENKLIPISQADELQFLIGKMTELYNQELHATGG